MGPSRKVCTLRGGRGVNALAYVHFEKNSTSNCCFPTHIRVTYSCHRCDLGHSYVRPGKVNMSNHFIITNYRPICSSDVIDVPDDESEQSPQVVENDGPMPIFENIFEILKSPFVEE